LYVADKLGIGTTGPKTSLQIRNRTIVQGVVGTQSLFGNNVYYDEATHWFLIEAAGGSAVRMIDGNIQFHTIASGVAGADISTEMDTTGRKMTILNNGNVGIGTTSPSNKLLVNQGSTGSNAGAIADFQGASTEGAYVAITDPGIKRWLIGMDDGGGTLKIREDTNTGDTDLVIDISGNVGIGTTGPNARLDLGTGYGTSGAKLLMYNDNATSELAGTKCGFYMDNYTPNNLNLVFPEAAANPGLFTITAKNTSGTTFKPYFSVAGLTGNVGIGTTSPGYPLDIKRTAGAAYGTMIPMINLNAYFTGYDENAVRATIDAGVPPVSFGNTTYGQMGFSTRGVDGLIQRMTIYPNGNVGIGTTSPGYKFQVYIDASYEGHVTSTGTWASSSDIRFKKNVSDLKGGLDKILKLRPVRYDSKTEPDSKGLGRHLGFIAQEFEKAVPELVSTDNRGYKAIAYGDLTIVLTKAIQEQQSQLQKDREDIEYLKQELIGSTAMLIESNKSLKANTKEIQDLKAEIVSLEGKVVGKQ